MEALWIIPVALAGTSVVIAVAAITARIAVRRDRNREADFFEPVQYPNMDDVDGRLLARKYLSSEDWE